MNQIVYAVNSPFDRFTFKLSEVERWLRSGRAKLLERKCELEPLFMKFADRFANLIREQSRREEGQRHDDEHYDRQLGNFTAVWRGKRSGGMNVMQMEKQWPK